MAPPGFRLDGAPWADFGSISLRDQRAALDTFQAWPVSCRTIAAFGIGNTSSLTVPGGTAVKQLMHRISFYGPRHARAKRIGVFGALGAIAAAVSVPTRYGS
jgi:hypothetical protein